MRRAICCSPPVAGRRRRGKHNRSASHVVLCFSYCFMRAKHNAQNAPPLTVCESACAGPGMRSTIPPSRQPFLTSRYAYVTRDLSQVGT